MGAYYVGVLGHIVALYSDLIEKSSCITVDALIFFFGTAHKAASYYMLYMTVYYHNFSGLLLNFSAVSTSVRQSIIGCIH